MTNTFVRKLRKLRRSPRAFFADSWISRTLHACQVPLASEGLAATKTSMAEPEAQSVASATLVAPPDFCRIGITGQIAFSPSGKGPVGIRCALVVREDQDDFVQRYLIDHQGFDALAPPRLNVGYFNHQLCNAQTELEFINRIPHSAKKNLANIDLIFLVNAPASLVNALGACAPHLRVFSIATDPGVLNALDSRLVTGIVQVGFEKPTQTSRRIYCTDLDSLHLALRRIVIESAPKSPDLLLPVRGGQNGFIGIRDFDTRRFGGIAFSTKVVPKAGRTFAEFLVAFDQAVTDIYLSESIYLRYRTVCEQIESGGTSTEFFAKALADGIRFEVVEAEEIA